jgi:oligoribonuclease NrnB/cAMP/cGMP phosphodiesterase (DHH superfamily)
MEFIPMNYGVDFAFGKIESREQVYILDYSIEPEEMVRLLRRTNEVVWIDHHKTAIEKYKDFPQTIKGIRREGVAGCELTYAWIKGLKGPHLIEDIPEYIRLIGDRDTWTWKYGVRVKFFFAGLQAENMEPTSPIWEVLHSDGKDKVDQIVKVGGYIQRYKDHTQQEALRENGFWLNWEGHDCYAICGRYSSEPFEAVVPEADIWLTFRYMPDGFWMVSLYSTEIDVSKIATKYEYHGKKGGGHTKAAGFECVYPPFLPLSLG